MDFYTETIPPNDLPVTLNEVKAYSKITWRHEDDMIYHLMYSATMDLEKYTNRVFISRTILGEYDLEEFSKFERYGYVTIRRSPLGEIESIEVATPDGWTALEGTILKDKSSFARVLLSENLPTLDENIERPLRITFTAGFSDVVHVPEPIRVAILKLVNFNYRNRGDCAASCKGTNVIYKSLSRYRIMETF